MKPNKKRRYQTAEDMQKAIDAYFANPHTKPYIYKGETFEVYAMTVEYITINHLGFKSKQSLYDYKKNYPGEGYEEVISNLIDRLIDYWHSAGEHGNGAFAAYVLASLGRDKERVKFEENMTSLKKANKLLELAGNNEISLDTMQKMMAGVKAESDINKVDELERLVRELADMAGIK